MKKILLINCCREERDVRIKSYTDYILKASEKIGADFSIEEVYDADILPARKDFSAVMISGSASMISRGEYEEELLEFISRNIMPLLGICYGHQVLARAFGCSVRKGSRHHKGYEEILKVKHDKILEGFPEKFQMHESHWEYVIGDSSFNDNFELLAVNSEGGIECVKHRNLPVYGVQFHPEMSGENGIILLMNYLKILV